MRLLVFPFVLSLLIVTHSLAAQFISNKIERTDEKSLRIEIEFGAGTLKILRSSDGNLCEIKHSAKGGLKPQIEYHKKNKVGFLSITTSEDDSGNSWGFDKHYWIIELAEDIPISLELATGASKNELDLTDLRIENFSISTGASKSEIIFNKPNKIILERFEVNTGASKMHLMGLSNANFKNFNFEGGAGAYALDFSGKLNAKAFAKIEVGVGSLKLNFPRNVSAKLDVEEGFLCSFSIDLDAFDKIGSESYSSKNFNENDPKLYVSLEAGIGKIRVQAKD